MTDTSQWPFNARLIARLRRDGDKGVGDTLARYLDRINETTNVKGLGEKTLTDWFTRITGETCGCKDKQGKLNRKYPYA